jgi:perosamine synthetase
MLIPFLRAPLNQQDIDAAVAVLKTSSLTAGHETENFEQEFADYIGTKHAIAVNSGTSALDLIFKTLILKGDLKMADRVIVPSFTYVACANVLRNNGLYPVFVDIDTRDLNMDVASHQVTENIRAILAVHTFGRPANLINLMNYADEYALPVIEDCAESIGASYNGQKVGSYGHAGAFSLIATKGMTCGEGGMITTDNWETAMIARDLRQHGVITGRRVVGTGVQYADVVRPGYNYRLTEFQAAIGRSQLKRLDLNNDARVKNSEYLNTALEDCPLKLTLFPTAHDRSKYAPMIFSFLIPSGYTQESRDEILRRICHAGVDAKVYFNVPIHKYTFYREYGEKYNLKRTEDICNRIITLPCYPGLTHAELDYMAESVRTACQ